MKTVSVELLGLILAGGVFVADLATKGYDHAVRSTLVTLVIGVIVGVIWGRRTMKPRRSHAKHHDHGHHC